MFEHDGARFGDELHEILRSLAVQGGDGLLDLQAVADREPKRLIHVGNDGASVPFQRIADLHHRGGKFFSLFDRLHKGAAAELNIQKDGIGTARQFLRHDARGDERDALDGPRDVTKGIEFFVGRIDF